MSDSNIWTTYHREDGNLIQENFLWVDSIEAFDDIVETTKVIKETWILQNSEIITLEPVFWSEDFYNDEEDN